MFENFTSFEAILLIVVVLYVSFLISKFITKRKFMSRYGLRELPSSVKVRKTSRSVNENHYFLTYPYWAIQKKDGTADRRAKYNRIIWRPCKLYVDTYDISSNRPYDLLSVIKALRNQGVEIALCDEEKEKYARIWQKKHAFAQAADIQSIVNYYAAKPTDFEQLCADLFNSLGYATTRTPPTNDGGYDIMLYTQTDRAIVECKCYSPKHKVGRPVVQKLVGANHIVAAERMIFVTTSDFSDAAVCYAKQVGVELINGETLLCLLSENGFLERAETEVDISEYQLNPSDLCPYVPADIYREFFV